MNALRQFSLRIHAMPIPRYCLILPFIYMGVIFFLSEIPGDSVSGTITSPLLKHLREIIFNGAHIPLYALLAWLWCWSLAGWQIGLNRRLTLAFCLTVLYGISDEWHQNFVPGRDTSFLDVMLDMLGAYLAVRFYQSQQPANVPG